MEEQALKMFSSILVYCGLEEPGELALEFLWNFWKCVYHVWEYSIIIFLFVGVKNV